MNQDNHRQRNQNNRDDLPDIVIAPAPRHRFAGYVDLVVFVLVFLNNPLHVLKEFAIFDRFVIKGRGDHGALVVGANELS